MANMTSVPRSGRVSIAQAVAAGAATFGVVFVACWVGAHVPAISATHAYISLFTTAPVDSTAALVEGTGWSIAFGALAAGALAFFYNLFAFLDGRRR